MSDGRIARDILKDYIPVNERIEAFYAKHPEGSLQAEIVPELTNENRICMRAYAYRVHDDPRPGIGYSWLSVPGLTPYTRGSEIENCETSAWGRAIASLGFEVKRGIASREEIESKQPSEEIERTAIRDESAPLDLGPHVFAGAVFARSRAPTDCELRQGPGGAFLMFGLDLGGGKRIPQVRASGALADDLWNRMGARSSGLVGQKVVVEGQLWDVPFVKDGRHLVFQRLELDRIETADFTLPVPAVVPEGQEELFEPGPARRED